MASPSPSRGESCEFVFARGSSVHQRCFNYALTNWWFGLCRSMWVIKLLVTLPSPHPGTLTRPSTPKVLWTKECAPTFDPFAIFTLDSHLNLSRSLGACHSLLHHASSSPNMSSFYKYKGWCLGNGEDAIIAKLVLYSRKMLKDEI